MTTPRLNIAELDFDTILGNFRAYLRTQDEYKDFDFDGAGITVLLKLLSYNNYYGSYYLNMVANEMHLDTALLAGNIYAHAKSLGYLPDSMVAATAVVDISATTPGAFTDLSMTLPRFQQFQSEAVDGVNYTFVTTDAVSGSRASAGDPMVFSGVSIRQGEPISVSYSVQPTTNPKLRFAVPAANVDISTLAVVTQLNSNVVVWQRNTDVAEVTANSQVYFIEKGNDERYTVYFGDGVIGQQPNTGDTLILSYIVTVGAPANKATSFTMQSTANISSATIVTANSAAGGAAMESLDSIKFKAPIYHAAQNRAVTKSDYEIMIKKDFPQVASVSVWGGEENEPPIYGRIFIALSMKEGYSLSQSDKDTILKQLRDNRVTLSVYPTIVDPDYTFIKLKTTAEYDKSATLLSKEQIKNKMYQAAVDYNTRELWLFNSRFILSKLARQMDDSDPSIIGSSTRIFLEKRFSPESEKAGNYLLKFHGRLRRGTILDKLNTTSFALLDNNGVLRNAFFEEAPLSYTGIDSISIVNPGYGYLNTPTITITGDGTGANASVNIVNGAIETITLHDRGTDYTTAIVSITGGGGSGAEAVAQISSNHGVLRTAYINELQEKVIINANAGTIDYETGTIEITNFQPVSFDQWLSFSIESEDNILQSHQKSIIAIDTADPYAISISLSEI